MTIPIKYDSQHRFNRSCTKNVGHLMTDFEQVNINHLELGIVYIDNRNMANIVLDILSA